MRIQYQYSSIKNEINYHKLIQSLFFIFVLLRPRVHHEEDDGGEQGNRRKEVHFGKQFEAEACFQEVKVSGIVGEKPIRNEDRDERTRKT